jgi:hypothetical protein
MLDNCPDLCYSFCLPKFKEEEEKEKSSQKDRRKRVLILKFVFNYK